ncbi:MAG: AAA family ATPase [Candidatus Eisenbacteria bacterium]
MKTIAISGKGGTGKTTTAAMIIRWLADNRSKSILAVDADSTVSLNDMLGIAVPETVGAVREEMKRLVNDLPGGMTKQQFLDYKIQSGLVETPEFDLLAMGRPEGPGCYCYANNVLRDILDTLSKNYDYVVIDNEAGMEHLSRRTAQAIDYMLMVSDPIVRGIRTAGKISRLLEELHARVGERYLILNRVIEPPSDALKAAIADEGLKHLGSLPQDDRLLSRDRAGEPIWEALTCSSAYRALGRIMKELMAR